MISPPATLVADTMRFAFSGDVWRPGDDGYEAGRGSWHRTIDPYPSVVAEATTSADVRTAVLVAREHGLPFAVQSTGHGTHVPADGGLLLKTARLATVDVDPIRRTVQAGPGARWSDVVSAAAPYDLAPLSGTLSVGVAGFTLGGGAGFLSRTFGFAADSLVRAEIVTSDGRFVNANAAENDDLFWAIRGGGGNFGVVTSLELQLFPVSKVFAGTSLFPADRAAHVLTYYRDWAFDEPAELSTAIMTMRLPHASHVPATLRGRPVLGIRAFCVAGAIRARRHLASLLDVAGPPMVDGLGEHTFAEASALRSGPPQPPAAVDHRFELLTDIPGDVVDAVVNAAEVPGGRVELTHWGGAMARPGPHAGPTGHRDVPFSVTATATAADVDALEASTAYLDRFTTMVQRHATGGSFLNFLIDPTRTETAYTAANYCRLTEIKRIWDPDNFFQVNHNIPPKGQQA